jgi:hypothetical protein
VFDVSEVGQTRGHINRLKWCKDFFDIQLEYDLTNVCTERRTDGPFKVGDDTAFASDDC